MRAAFLCLVSELSYLEWVPAEPLSAAALALAPLLTATPWWLWLPVAAELPLLPTCPALPSFGACYYECLALF